MNVNLPTSLQDFIQRKIAAGEFETVDEAVCEGVRLLQHQDEWKSDTRARIDVGWQQAKSGQLRTPEQVRENLAARKEVWKRLQDQ